MTQYRLNNSPIVYYVSENGHDQWVLFLHAAFVNHDMFRTQVEYFSKFYNVIVPDIIGHGASTDTKKGDNLEKMAHWLNEILDRHSIDRIHMVGVSVGAVLGQDFANKYPQRLRSLTCFGGYDINNFDPKMQQKNSAAQMLMMLKAIFSVKWFAQDNKKISAYTEKAQNEFYDMNLRFPKKSFMYLAGLNAMVNVHAPHPQSVPPAHRLRRT